jgi:hypothetical protein
MSLQADRCWPRNGSRPDGGKQAGITFQRIIVWPDGHKEIEGVTPKQLPKPAGDDER